MTIFSKSMKLQIATAFLLAAHVHGQFTFEEAQKRASDAREAQQRASDALDKAEDFRGDAGDAMLVKRGVISKKDLLAFDQAGAVSAAALKIFQQVGILALNGISLSASDRDFVECLNAISLVPETSSLSAYLQDAGDCLAAKKAAEGVQCEEGFALDPFTNACVSTVQNSTMALPAPSHARSPTTTACSEQTFEIDNLDSGTEFPRDSAYLLDSKAAKKKRWLKVILSVIAVMRIIWWFSSPSFDVGRFNVLGNPEPHHDNTMTCAPPVVDHLILWQVYGDQSALKEVNAHNSLFLPEGTEIRFIGHHYGMLNMMRKKGHPM